MLNEKREKEIHELFDVTLILKGLHALVEIVGGFLLYVTSTATIVKIVSFFVADEIKEDPRDTFSNYFIHLAQQFSGSSKTFAILYLVIHGIINSIILFGLWKEKMWSYPVSLIILALSIPYQLYRFTFTHSILLVALSVLDIVVIFLVWHEYGVVKKKLLTPFTISEPRSY